MSENKNYHIIKLKKLIDKKGFDVVAKDLGYNSISTVKHWIKSDSVPALAQEKLKTYLKGEKK